MQPPSCLLSSQYSSSNNGGHIVKCYRKSSEQVETWNRDIASDPSSSIASIRWVMWHGKSTKLGLKCAASFNYSFIQRARVTCTYYLGIYVNLGPWNNAPESRHPNNASNSLLFSSTVSGSILLTTVFLPLYHDFAHALQSVTMAKGRRDCGGIYHESG